MPHVMPDHQEPKRERVIVTPLGLLTMETSNDGCPPFIQDGWREWPPNEFFINALQAYRHLLLPDDPSNREDDLQIQARRALLQEYGIMDRGTTADTDRMAVQNAWEQAIQKAAVTNDNNDNVGDDDETTSDSDLIEFFRDGGKSNHRQLEWAIMDCAPGCQFQLHAHPNLELVYCLKGELHEVRLIQEENVKLVRDFETTGEQTKNRNPQVIGPSLLECPRPWRFGILSQGQWLVNRVGSIHKSFTAAKGDGCILLALWGGSHANIAHEPIVVVQAVETMDRRLDCSCRGGEWIAETFLPHSEKSTN